MLDVRPRRCSSLVDARVAATNHARRRSASIRDGSGTAGDPPSRLDSASSKGARLGPRLGRRLAALYTLKRKCMTSPSWTTYSLPSIRSLPAAFAAASLPSASKSA